MPAYNTLSEAISDLATKGYTEDFSAEPECLHCASKDIRLHPEDFQIDEFYRFEGMSNPDDNSILYAISGVDGSVKGLLVDAYGVYAEQLSPSMIEKLRFREPND